MKVVREANPLDVLLQPVTDATCKLLGVRILWDWGPIRRSLPYFSRHLVQHLDYPYTRFLLFSPDHSALQPIPERVQLL